MYANTPSVHVHVHVCVRTCTIMCIMCKRAAQLLNIILVENASYVYTSMYMHALQVSGHQWFTLFWGWALHSWKKVTIMSRERCWISWEPWMLGSSPVLLSSLLGALCLIGMRTRDIKKLKCCIPPSLLVSNRLPLHISLYTPLSFHLISLPWSCICLCEKMWINCCFVFLHTYTILTK